MVGSARALALASLWLAGCGLFSPEDSDPDPGSEVVGGSVRVEGRVVDLVTGQPVSGAATVTTSGLVAVPALEVQGSTFVLDRIPENSVFHLQAAVPPSHRATSSAIEVTTEDRAGLTAPAVAETFLGQLAGAFGVTPATTRGVLLAQIVGDAGQPRSGIAAASFAIDGGAAIKGPYFLDAAMAPAPGTTATSASGWVVYFEIAPGLVGLRAASGAPVTFDMPVSPASAGVVTVARVRTIDGTFVPPKNVSFAQQVFPIFARRGCVACHAEGKDPGRELGNLTLNNDQNNVYNELTKERAGRVVVATPETSTLLTMPSREDPPDRHPNVTFTSKLDPDYQLIRAWIAEGALQN
jgi:hypothetical protein